MTTEIRLLGSIEVIQDGVEVRVGGPKPRGVLALLALNVGRVVSTDRLLDGLWGPDASDGVAASLQVHISNLRKALGPVLGAAVVTRSPGYVLDLPPESIDVVRFESLTEQSRVLRRSGDLAGARAGLAEALSLWRCTPLDDLKGAPFSSAVVVRLEEQRQSAVEEQIDLMLADGEHHGLVAVLESAVSEHPLREHLWCQLMVALYRCGRQADALAAYRRAREHLLDELGIEPGAELRALELAVLDQSPSLDLVTAPATEATGIPARATRGSDGSDPGVTVKSSRSGRAWVTLDDGSERVLDGAVVLGRHPDSDIALSDPSVSRSHAEIRPAVGGWLLIDLDSTNGTSVNDQPTVHRLLDDGDVLAIGFHRITYHSTPEDSVAE